MFDKSKLWATGLLLAAFAAGVAVGSATDAVFGMGRPWTAVFGQRGRDPDRDRRPNRSPAVSYLDRLDRELKLSPAQRDSVSAILKRYDEPMREMWRGAWRQIDSLRLRVRTEIGTVLDQDQRRQFQVMNQRMDSLRAVRERGGSSREDR